MTPVEARALAKVMFRQLAKMRLHHPEFFERAAVLADVLLQSNRPDVGEALALAVQASERRHDPMPKLANAVAHAEVVMFAPRRSPCMPNAKELRQLVENEHGTGLEARRELRRLNAALRETCGYRSYSIQHLERVMDVANGVLGGHGVERAAYEIDTPRGMERLVDFYYLNMGDTYASTLIIHQVGPRHDRFYISTWGSEVESAERRFGENGMWRT